MNNKDLKDNPELQKLRNEEPILEARIALLQSELNALKETLIKNKQQQFDMACGILKRWRKEEGR